VIATGKSVMLRTFIAEAFDCFGLDWKKHVVSNAELMRPTDVKISVARPDRAACEFGWRAHVRMPEVARRLAAAAAEALKAPQSALS
jgi:GDPmannose 4,6-dehydratase